MQNKNLIVVVVFTICLLLLSFTPTTTGDSEALETSSKVPIDINFEDPKSINFEHKIIAKKYIPRPPEPAPKPSNTFVVTGYSQSAEEGTADGVTASGRPVSYGVCAADTNHYPFGTKFNIPGYGVCTVWDTGGAIKGNRIDAFFPTRQDAFTWGTRTLKVTVL